VITNYTELKAAIATWIHRTDLTSVIPDFISLAEERMNRHLRTREMEVTLAETLIVDGRIPMPAGTVAVKTIWVPNYEATPLRAQPYEQVLTMGINSIPTAWARQGADLVFDGNGSVQGVLYEGIDRLGDSNASNWLLASHPSVYLFGALAEASTYVKNVEDAMLYQQRMDRAMDEISGNSMRDSVGGPLVSRRAR
jgi:hypothetical protein